MDPQRNASACPVLWGDARTRITRVSHRARELGWELTVLHRVRLPRGGCSDMEEPDINKPANSGQWSGRHVTAWVSAGRDYWSGRPPQSMGEVAR